MTSPRPDQVHLVRDSASGVEAVRARFAGHAYDLHRHDDWLVGVTDRGVQDFLCRGARRRSTPGRIILMEPGELHDGQAGTEEGFAYTMLYLPREWLRSGLLGSREGDSVLRAPISDDPALGRAVRTAYMALANPVPRLAREAALDDVLGRLRPHLQRPDGAVARCRAPRVAWRARDRIHADLAADIGADALASAAGAADRFQLARQFRAEFGTSPHAYLVQMRLLRARALLADGEQPAAVAAACGFADQSHLGRWFRRAYGVTPATYRNCCTGVPDCNAAPR